MDTPPLLTVFFIIFTGAAVLATVALFARQAMIVAYILLGVVVGPGGVALIKDVQLIEEISTIGIVFLLFLLGLDLRPSELFQTLGKITRITLASTLCFGLIGTGIAVVAGFSPREAFLIGATFVFSSTILGIKLLPTTVLHHKHMGQLMIGILLLQDLIAIAILLLLESFQQTDTLLQDMLQMLLGLPVLGLVAWYFGRTLLIRLFLRFDTIKEYIFLVTVGWCLGLAELSHMFGFSHEIGAFLAGITLATTPIAEYIAETLKPLRDFFLVLFFFALGASFNLQIIMDVWLWALILAGTALLVKPVVFHLLLKLSGERRDLSFETGVRLGQISEFSLLVAVVALNTNFIGDRAAYLIQTATVIGFVVSSYWIVMRYPTPIAVSSKLRRD